MDADRAIYAGLRSNPRVHFPRLLYLPHGAYSQEQLLDDYTICLGIHYRYVPFHSPIMLLVALTMGITYIFNYQEYRNLLAITISHAVVGAVLIMVRNFYLPY